MPPRSPALFPTLCVVLFWLVARAPWGVINLDVWHHKTDDKGREEEYSVFWVVGCWVEQFGRVGGKC